MKNLLLLVLGLSFLSSSDFAQGQGASGPVWQQFMGRDEDSKTKIDHYPFSYFLNNTVLFVGRSRGFLGNEKPQEYRNSRIKVSQSLTPSRFENSRMLLHMFGDEHIQFFKDYQAGLEALTERKALQKFNSNEQLALLLNLYNVVVINKVVAEYPIQNLRGLRDDEPGGDDFWHRKVTAINGIPVSLVDIEQILINKYDSPLVVFGLWQGTIGGPRLRNIAYSSDDVWRALELNAVEFVNSNRGLRPPRGSTLKASIFYDWMLPAFGTSKQHVLMFIKDYADPNFVSGLESVSDISFDVYDWQVADVMGGSLHTGSHSQMGGVLSGKSGVAGAPAEAGGALGGIMDFFKMADSVQAKNAAERLPAPFFNLLMGMRQNTRAPVPIITTEECPPGDPCGASEGEQS